MHPVTVLPTRRPTDWRAPTLLAVAGLAATLMLVLRRPRAGRARLSWRRRPAP